MNKAGKIILGIFLLGYVIGILLFKYSGGQGTAKQVLLGGTTIFSFTFRSDFSIFILSILSFFSINKLYSSILKKHFIYGLLFSCASLFCIVLPGHFIATQSDGSEMREYLFFCEIKKTEIVDLWIAEKISGGYDKAYHYNSDYPCFRYCDSFFTRQYQIGKNEMFNVFNGIGPLFNLENETFYKN